MLINYFKPEYNEQYVNTLPGASHAVYARLRDAGVKNVQVDLNLYMQSTRETLRLRSVGADTGGARHISVYGALEALEKGPQSSIISADVMPEELYPLFIGE